MGEKFQRSLSRYWPILFRASLYFFIGALPELIGRFSDAADGKAHVSVWWWVVTGSKFAYDGLVPLRAFYDGSAERHSEKLQASDTQMLMRGQVP